MTACGLRSDLARVTRHAVALAWVSGAALAGKPLPIPTEATSPHFLVSDRDVARSTIEGSPELVVSRDQQRIFGAEERRQRAILWVPNLTIDTFWRGAKTPTDRYDFSASGTVDESTYDLDIRLGGKTLIGTTYELRFDNRRTTTTAYADFFPTSPTNRSELSLLIVQPILRGASPQGNTANIANAEHSALAQKAETQRVAETLVDEAVERYYAWAGSIAEVGVRKAALKLAEDQRAATVLKIKGGALSPLDIAQADATVSARKAEIVEAERQTILAERDMLRVAYLQARPGFTWSTLISPATTLGEPSEDANLEEAIEVALKNRPEVRRQLELVAAQEPRVQGLKWDRLWKLDLRAQLGGVGLSGTLNPTPFPGDIPNPPNPQAIIPGRGTAVPDPRIIGGFFDAMAHPYSMGTYFYQIGLTLEIPLVNTARNAELEQAELELHRRRAELERARAEVAVNVRAAVLTFRAAREGVRLGKEAVRLAEANLDAEQRKFKGGVSTTFDVLRVQAEASLARLALVKALVQMNVAAVKLRRERGNLLDDYGITVR